MGVVDKILFLPLFPLFNYTSQNSQSQAVNPKKKAIFFKNFKKIFDD
jgi:hypothetical protein